VYYKNPEVDRLIDSAALETDDGRRGALYAKAQQLIAEDVPYVSLWYKKNIAVYQADISGVQLSPIADFGFLRNVSRHQRTD
jgi:peptide/nickel transport system substrate-binding protein